MTLSSAYELVTTPPRVGDLVQVRSRRWLVEEVSPPERPGDSAVLTLACAEEDAQGEPLSIYWDYELDRDPSA